MISGAITGKCWPTESTFIREPVEQAYGTVAVFEDLYGNLWDLVEHKEDSRFSQHRSL